MGKERKKVIVTGSRYSRHSYLNQSLNTGFGVSRHTYGLLLFAFLVVA